MSSQARQNQTFILPDGRQLGYAEYGDHDGTPLLYFHGFPACRLEAYAVDDIARRRKIRLLSLDRPGFGLSTPQPNRSILDWPTDVSNFAKGMQLSRFAVMGLSGGGPYALACAYALPQESLIGVGLFASGPPWIAGAHHNSRYRRLVSSMAKYWPGGLRLFFGGLVGFSKWLANTGPIARTIDRWLELEDEKKEVEDQGSKQETATTPTSKKTTSERRLDLVHALLEEPFAQGSRAAVDEARLLSSTDWGFSLGDVGYNTVRIWHGAEDKNAPVSMIHYMVRKLPHCVYHEFKDDTHYTMFKHLEGAIAEIILEKNVEDRTTLDEGTERR
ncbi:alpha/beta-Hydrolase [Glarea lozoyensis ATCC 20868]|uniref:Alpha/beta-Hydrolase n=1 Tax=Glarea lozoyensis (strain ATCC 20868 / MF5171) TaxID=1116229 RepID=S3CI95_GLAL2|nr:alpha/beta-Hydrolase [Glarea lozoyensis ATCC 20868]EPE24989.1 alpha/beta-Hydrolase [Glarea lozoyensis ATCC 20868]